MQKQQTTRAAKSMSPRAIAAAKTRALKREIVAGVAQYSPDAAGEAAAWEASQVAHHAHIAAWAASQAANEIYGYLSDEAEAARRAYVEADRAAMLARCVYAQVKSAARYMALYGRVI
jgi:hypothetical protein